MRNISSFVFLISSLAACADRRERPLFKLLGPNETGVTFANTITTSDTLNVQTDVYVYNGAGVAVGDIDNDGLVDLFFSGNMVSSRLYVNKGHMRFEDITSKAGITTRQWATGATMVDINNDGFLDIYVSVSGPEWSTAKDRANLLFINNGNRTFTERAAQYALADTGFTTHSVFVDFDRDGCLDLFLLNNSPRDFSRGDVASHPSGMRAATPGSHNELYRNDCKGKFTNVSKQTGVINDSGFGLGVAVSDLNGDGWPDIYVSNDVAPNDVVYVNNQNGTLTNKRAVWLKHTSVAGMGVDIADFNNDGWDDILQVDMLPHDLGRRKRMSGVMSSGDFLQSRSRGFLDDYGANSLQMSNGVTKNGDPVFSDIASLAGVAATDWSWSPLFADFDNDGYKDIFVGNGYPKAVNDLDYMPAAASAQRRGNKVEARRLLQDLPPYDVSNYVFRNNGDLSFADKTSAWGLTRPSFSYGAAYADLDNDGKLDLVVNNIDAPAFIYHNVQPSDDAHHYLSVRLVGTPPNVRGTGAKVILTSGGMKQHIYNSPYRGFMSTVDERAHFGLGAAKIADSLEVIWPGGTYQLLTNVTADQSIVVKQSDANAPMPSALGQNPLFREAGDLRFAEQSRSIDDYSVQSLLPYAISAHGPPLAVADLNGDRLDDAFVGDSPGHPAKIFLQKKDGTFAESNAQTSLEADKAHDDWGALFFDANGDGKPDLYVASGGYPLAPSSSLLQDRLYINRGNGELVRDSAALPRMLTSTSAVRAADFNGDGKPDLFVGGTFTPRSYPSPTRSYLLRNDGNGRFTDVTAQLAPELVNPGGMIRDAVWVDFNGDGRVDLVTAGEWMPVEFYRNEGSRFSNVTKSTGLPPMRGWWFSLATGDFDKDGKPDIVAGNLGLNYTYRTSAAHTFGVYAGSFTGNRTTDIVLTDKANGNEFPYGGLTSLGREIYTLALRYPTYGSFAQAPIAKLLGRSQLEQAVHYETDTFASMYLHNEAGGKFSAAPLPNAAQISPLKSIIPLDVDRDGYLDLIVAGNLYQAEANTPRADAGNGLWLRGNGKGGFATVSPRESGFLAPRDVSGMALVKTSAGRSLIVANTGDSIQTFRLLDR
ncbi:MAG TPA: VCBS repeat-containing protein [Gemmatimonadaceae bacterium]|nr:VCBS repeat-containing protein [Gemmatimonadaceae bacterium]